MSLVEKAAEKLKERQPDAAPHEVRHDERVEALPVATTLERAQERMQARASDTAEDSAASLPWHVDLERLKRAGLIPVEADAQRRLSDELRRVKRPLLNNTGGKGAKALAHGERIVVTSAVPGEGKSFTTLNLALSLAREPDFEVLLVDGDVPKSDITRSLGLEGKPGLMDVLIHTERQPSDVIVRTDVPNLLVVPAGERHPLSAELLGGKRMQQVLKAWSGQKRQRLLVFDSPPLLATSEAQVLLSHMGQVVMLVAAGRTRRQDLNAAMQAVEPSQYVGLVLNMSRLPSGESHYYDGYYSNYYGQGMEG